MWNEHFGIGVVEMMSAGLVTVAHDSGGPKADIIVRPWDFGVGVGELALPGAPSAPTGCLATTTEEYAEAMYQVLKRGALSEEVLEIRKSGREAAKQFSDQVFMDSFKGAMLESSLFR